MLPVVLLCVAVLVVPAPGRALDTGAGRLAPDSPIGVHSMLYLTHPFSAKQAMFKEAAAIGASTIRLDIELWAVFVDPNGPPDWSGVDQYMWLARRYHLRVLADLLATPGYAADCPPGTPSEQSYRCPPSDPVLWGRDAGAVAAHTRGVINDFEIINEPDGSWAFLGSPEQYADILAASYDAIHAANPTAQVALGGLMNIGAAGVTWMDAMLAAPSADAAHKFDIANIHVRTSPGAARAVVCGWRRYFATQGFAGPLWVTETGYPADPAEQTDPAYQGGPGAQARYLTAGVLAMIRAGAGKVFVTERDSLSGRFASEGVLQSTDPLTAFPRYTRRPSFYSVRALSRRDWRAVALPHGGCPAAPAELDHAPPIRSTAAAATATAASDGRGLSLGVSRASGFLRSADWPSCRSTTWRSGSREASPRRVTGT